MKKIKIGYLPLYIKLYDDINIKSRDPLVKYMDTLISMLEGTGIEVVRADEVCRVKEEFARAAKKFNDCDVDAVVTQHLAYSPSLESIEALLSLKAPIIVLDTTPDYQLIQSAGYYNGIDKNHGIHGVQDMCNLLKRSGRKYTICAGHAYHSEVINEVAGMCRAAAAAKAYREAKIGSVGGSFTGMGDFAVTPEEYREKIGAQVAYMKPETAKKYLNEVSEEEINEEIAADRLRFCVEVKEEANYRAATRSGLAVRKWMDAEGLSSLTVNFLTIDESGLPKMPFTECCKTLGRGKGYAGEGDVLTAGLVGALASVYPDTTFSEMFCPDWERQVVLLSHMGESNPNLAQWKPVVRDCRFRYNSTGDTVGMYSCLRPGKVVWVNLAPMGDHFKLIVSAGEIIDAGLELGAYRNNNQGWLKPGKALGEFLKDFSMEGGTHHSAMVYDADIKEIKAFGEMMGFEVVEI